LPSLPKLWITVAEPGTSQTLFQQNVKMLVGIKGIPSLELSVKYQQYEALRSSKK
jgi:hypothetical protein